MATGHKPGISLTVALTAALLIGGMGYEQMGGGRTMNLGRRDAFRHF